METLKIMRLLYLWFLVTLIMVGALLIIKSQSYPWYEPHGPEVLDYSELSRENRTGYWEKKSAELETPRKLMHDSGQGVVALSATLIFLYFSYGFPFKGTQTPVSSRKMYTLYIFPLILEVPASFYYHFHRFSRFEYPPWSDNLRAPVILTAIVCFSIAVIGIIIMDTLLSFGQIPANLYVWPGNNRTLHVFIALAAVILCGLCVLGIGLSVLDGDMGMVIILTVVFYIILSLRATLANGPEEYLAFLSTPLEKSS